MVLVGRWVSWLVPLGGLSWTRQAGPDFGRTDGGTDLVLGVVLHPRLEVLQGAHRVELVDVRDAQGQERGEVVGVLWWCVWVWGCCFWVGGLVDCVNR